MRLTVRILAMSITAVMASAWLALPATAGGPTSVIVVNPLTGDTGSLYASDDDYNVLHEALGPGGKSADAEPPSLGEGPGNPSTINVTWLVHDVSVWRVDRVNVHEDGTIWVRTYDALSADAPGIDWEALQQDWHRAADSDTVLAVLDRIGVLNRSDVRDQAVGQNFGSDEAAAAPAGGSAAALESEPTSPWWWALPAAVLGLVIGFVARPHLVSYVANRRDRGPRQQFVDV